MVRTVIFVTAALALVACERRGDKVIFDRGEAEQKVERSAEELRELGRETVDGTKTLGEKVREELGNEERKAPRREHRDEPRAMGGGPVVTDAGYAEVR